MSIQGAITETDIANYLANTPGFFERHAELLASIQLTSPHGQRAVSLQERQMEMLRDKNKGLESKIMEMIRHGQENVAIADRLHRFTRAMLLASAPGGLPVVLVNTLKHEFLIPQAAVRLWNMDVAFDGLPFAAPVSDDTRAFVGSLSLPYCGVNAGFEAVGWLDDPSTIASTALIPLRASQGGAPFGLLVLGSPDPTRYTAEMGTEFLMRLGEVAAAGCSRLLPVAG
ncbi:MAG: hypothetical protein CFE45_15650 [Burkholderiales bacterium PBB5]|nr:MAG: hypothetical protein CFE45_15650 [Burkholderiales bacterium PBB5]